MANSTSASLKLTVQSTGENSGTWGQFTNTNLLILEQAIGGYDAVGLNATTGATLTFSNGVLDSIEKTYLVENATTGAFTVTFKTTSGTGATWSTTDKGYKILYSDGTNIVDITADLGDITVGDVTSGGITATGNIVPGTTDAYDLGASGNVWRNLYTGDLHLSNQQKNQGNVVDGTKGNWTLQEGKDDIFMINNMSGEKFKINLSKIEGDS
jgi:hypothetical protein